GAFGFAGGGRETPIRMDGWQQGGVGVGGGDSDEAIALAGDGLEEARVFGIVAQGLADLADGGVDAVLGVDEDLGVPEALGDLGAGDEAAFGGGEEDEELERLALQTD